jgi:cell division transport system ATP-binding protein
METQVVILEKVDIFIKKKLILKDVNLNINKGDFVYFIGKVGSGKSSLLKLLYAEIPLEYGNAKVCGFDLKNIKQKQIAALRKKLGIIFQDFQLLNDRSVYENLHFVLKATGWKNKNEINAQIEKVLDKVGLIDKIYSMPHQLSGGEQQRIAIARALLNEPELIIADEPTGNLDPETSSEILSILKEIKQSSNAAVIIATHDYELIRQYPSTTYKFENNNIKKINE